MKKRNVDPFEIKSIQKIIQILWDGKKYSGYQITKQIDITISTTIQHLNRLSDSGYVKIEDATKGNLRRMHYSLTDSGKIKYIEYVKKELSFLSKLGRNRPEGITGEDSPDGKCEFGVILGGTRHILWREE